MIRNPLEYILEKKIIAVVRLKDGSALLPVAEALFLGGVTSIEVTMTVPDAVDGIRAVRHAFGDAALIGAGTVTTSAQLEAVIDAGAEFIVSPILDVDLLSQAQEHDALMIPGCLTPTEIFTAWRNGAEIVKVFPANIAGMSYLKDVHGPFPEIRLLPTGGVTVENARAWLDAGACAVALGSDLIRPEVVKAGNYQALTNAAKELVSQVHGAGS